MWDISKKFHLFIRVEYGHGYLQMQLFRDVSDEDMSSYRCIYIIMLNKDSATNRWIYLLALNNLCQIRTGLPKDVSDKDRATNRCNYLGMC